MIRYPTLWEVMSLPPVRRSPGGCCHSLSLDLGDGFLRRLMTVDHAHQAGQIAIHRIYGRIDGCFDEAGSEYLSLEIEAAFVTDFTVSVIHFEIADPQSVVGPGDEFCHGWSLFLRRFDGGNDVKQELLHFHLDLGDTNSFSVGPTKDGTISV